MYQSGLDPEPSVEDIKDLAYLCVDVGKAILNRENPGDAATLAEAA